MAIVDLVRGELELLAHQIEQGSERRDRRGDEIALYTRDGRLARARAGGELLLGKAVPTPCFAK